MKKILLAVILAVAGCAAYPQPAPAAYTVSTNAAWTRSTGDGAAVNFPFTWEFEANADIVVLKDGAGDNVFVTQTLTTDYTLAGAKTSGGGTVTFGTAPALNDVVIIYRAGDWAGPANFLSSLTLGSLNDKLNKLSLQVGQLRTETQQQCLEVPVTDPLTATYADVPTLVGNGDKVLGVNSGGTAFEYKANAQVTCNDAAVTCLFAGSASEGGPATTATALAANGANCSSGQYPLGVDASGTAESCTADADTTCNDAGVTCNFAGSLTEGGIANSALVLSVNPPNCAAGQYPLGTLPIWWCRVVYCRHRYNGSRGLHWPNR